MGAFVWIAAAVASVVVAAFGLRRRQRHRRELDVGPVSEGWLGEQRGRNDL